MIECPECGQHVRGQKCRCGWEVPQAKTEHRYSDPMHGCCDWVSDGRCHYPGVFGHGKDGPYYCRAHETCGDPVAGSQIVAQSHRESRPDYSYAARKQASLDRVAREIEAWNNRLKDAA